MENILNEVVRIKERIEAVNTEMYEFYMRLDAKKKLSTEGYNIVKAYQKMQEALLLVSSAAEIF